MTDTLTTSDGIELPADAVDITPGDSAVSVWLVPLTPEEEDERAQWAIEQAQREADEAKAAEDKEAALASAHAKLSKLGLNADEIAAIVGQ